MNQFYGYGVDQQSTGSSGGTNDGSNTWLGALGGWFDQNSDWLSGLGNTAGQVYSIDRALSEANRISDLGNYLNDWANQAGSQLNDNSQFKGYGITGTGLGPTTGSIDANGAFNLDFGVSPSATLANQGQAQRTAGGTAMNEAGKRLRDAYQMVNGVNYMDPSNQAIYKSLADPTYRQKQIYRDIMELQRPELQRQQAMQQAQEYAMGRSGVRGSMYGGTAEDAAMARARAQTSRQAAIDAMTQANEERANVCSDGC